MQRLDGGLAGARDEQRLEMGLLGVEARQWPARNAASGCGPVQEFELAYAKQNRRCYRERT